MLRPLGFEKGVNTSQPTRTSTGTETYDNPRKSQGAQTDREHCIGDGDDDDLMPVYTNVVHNSAATADYSGEIERQQSLVEHMQREHQRRAEEQLNNTRIEVQGLLQEQERQHREEAKAAIEAALNQQRQELEAKAEELFQQRKNEHREEAYQALNQQSQGFGNILNYAEREHLNVIQQKKN